MDVTDRIEKIIGPTIEDMGFDIVRIQISGAQRVRLQIMVERKDGAPIVVDDCADVSRATSALLDVDDPISAAYTLEVSSPGLDRPLVKLKDFERFCGYEVRIETHDLVAGRKRFSGRLLGVEGSTVRISCEGEDYELAFEDIHRAKLLMTDELLAEAQQIGN
ncbi:ribosome maturation factor RimP [Varunaivibrio sulfuroxidans]|uniref:Ribosome maturation factor RimP n=1 Tax=Varunaivibrio sulfuroxidans TaxID=1773489 RepID=A0A4R3JIF5_9PROT|nr:ribosome maturation factor RimP [Varunaivibrio sulfuroxidans]TCS65056.1 ribosome maturation factor RimP [Varunaivibrio sulfuroxidans]WES29657.1 ribosome maturation factor RimP [Varunaivibrio sulfuroxidans]